MSLYEPANNTYHSIEERPMDEEDEASKACSDKMIFLMLYHLAKPVVEALSLSIKIIVDVEPIMYESAFSLLSQLVACSPYWKEQLFVEEKNTGERIPIIFSLPYGFDEEVTGPVFHVIFDRDRKKEEILERVESILTKPRKIIFFVAQRPLEASFTSAIYKTNLIYDGVKSILKALDARYGKTTDEYREKLKYVGRVPYEILLFMSANYVKTVAKMWNPPPPENAGYLREPYRPFSELVLNPAFREILSRYISIIKPENRGSIMLIGLPGSGRKTIAKSISGELELPAYQISVANILSKLVGESESKLKGFFESLRARSGLAVFENVEVLFRDTSSESVTPNLRNVLLQEMSRDDNNFVIVFTTNEDAPQNVFDTPILGEVKLVVPLPVEEERKQLARIFLKEMAGDKWSTLVEITKKAIQRNDDEDAENVLYAMYADSFADATVGFTPGEIYAVMRLVIVPAIQEMIQKQQIIPVMNQIIKFTQRDIPARQAKVKKLIDHATAFGQYQIVDVLENVYNELMMQYMKQEKRKPVT